MIRIAIIMILFALIIPVILFVGCKVTKNREKYKRNSFLFFAETE